MSTAMLHFPMKSGFLDFLTKRDFESKIHLTEIRDLVDEIRLFKKCMLNGQEIQ